MDEQSARAKIHALMTAGMLPADRPMRRSAAGKARYIHSGMSISA